MTCAAVPNVPRKKKLIKLFIGSNTKTWTTDSNIALHNGGAEFEDDEGRDIFISGTFTIEDLAND